MVRKLRTTFQPSQVREVSESEYTDLRRQGLVLEELTTSSEPPDEENNPPGKTQPTNPNHPRPVPSPPPGPASVTRTTTSKEEKK